ncbi:MAG TPA: hypothetical protein VHU23_13110 [Rhizomicrobium sp.]|jgi:hypothetical protein|nr:hypothetical protein [Rhizomicrobium sp.]
MAEEVVKITFEGGLAAEGRLEFYEYSRSQYATARFIATVEHFRRSGKVADKIVGQSYINMTVEAPQRGSFLYDVAVQVSATVASGGVVGFLAYIWHQLAPRREKVDTLLIKLAEFRLFEERQRTLQSQERTKQLALLHDIAAGERASPQQAIDLLQWSVDAPNIQFQELEMSVDERVEALLELIAERDREGEIKKAEKTLVGFDESSINKLTSRLRPMVSEIALPLKRSANRMSIGSASANDNFIFLTDEIVKDIQARSPEEDTTTIIGRVKSYDRDAGVGKVQSGDLHRILNFIVPVPRRDELRDWILAAMQRDNVQLTCRRILDESGFPTSLILLDIKLDDEEAG